MFASKTRGILLTLALFSTAALAVAPAAIAGKIVAGGQETIIPVSPDGGTAEVVVVGPPVTTIPTSRDGSVQQSQIVGPNGIPWSITDAGVGRVHVEGYPSATQRCFEVTCSTAGDGGTLGAVPGDAGGTSSIVAGRRYVATTTSTGAVRLNPLGACGSFAGGTGRILNAGATLDWIAQAAPDGGVPLYSCCAESAGAVVQLCEQ